MKDKNNGLQVGTTLYQEIIKRNQPPEIQEVTVSKIGRLYFEIENGWGKKYGISNLKHKDKIWSQNNVQLYRSLEEIELKNEHAELSKTLSEYFNRLFHKELPLEQLREINQITKATEKINP